MFFVLEMVRLFIKLPFPVKNHLIISFIFLFGWCAKWLSQLSFVPNHGQWHKNVQYRADLRTGKLFIEKNAFTYLFFNAADIDKIHEAHHKPANRLIPDDYTVQAHAYQFKFLQADSSAISFLAEDKMPDYVNYFIGNDSTRWATHVAKYGQLTIKNLYRGIDVKWHQWQNAVKYDFIIAPHTDYRQIVFEIKGVSSENIAIDKKGNLHIRTSVNEMIESIPEAYQIINGRKKQVRCEYQLQENKISFVIKRGYNPAYPLVIDPLLIFASYTGSGSDNWGYTSTFDDLGHAYTGGVAFGTAYPVTLGAFQMSFAGGNGNTYSVGTDIVISKFSPNGTSLIYSTYLGGSNNESPHSLIVNGNNELLVLGSTSSADFPVTANGFDVTFAGGVNYNGIPSYSNGSDIVISKISSDGTTLLAGTFVGGSGNDGLNLASALDYNYADEFRGEIIVDDNNNVYVASSTTSADFPVTPGAFQTTIAGGQDGCVFKLSPDLSSLLWSTYFGGSTADAAYSIQLNRNGNPYFAGGTNSANLPVSANALHTTLQGNVDGYVAELSSNGGSLLAATYLGTSQYDQCYFVQLDTNDNVHVVGQTTGSYPVFPSTVYNEPNSGQFLHELSPDLSTTLMSTSFGRGVGTVDIALSAFLVNDCNYIFISGWGGVINSAYSSATNSTTNGLPVTPNAVQPSTDGTHY